ncbi:MAG: tetratricopeptide repeat protein [Acidobacteria bacterium]|nr:tetratricopeptide repeat protein [Acidobacteriota bacterium]
MSRIHFQRAFFFVVAVTLLVAASIAALAQSKSASKKTPSTSGQAKASVPPMDARVQAEFKRLSKQADQARESGRLEDAIALYHSALRLRPSWPEGWWYLSSIFYDRDRYHEAREGLRNLLALQPKNGPAWALIGLCEFQLSEYQPALADLQYAHALGLGESRELIAVARYHAAILMTRSQQFELGYEALRDFARQGNESLSLIEALGVNMLRMPFLPSEVPPDKRELILLAGRAAFHMAARHIQATQRAFQELLVRYPETPNVHYGYGVFLLTDTPDAALAEFQRELQISPMHLAALMQIAFEYLKRSDFEAAKPYAEKAVEVSPKLFATHNALGRVLLELGKVDEAIQELEVGTRLAPDSPEMHFALAKAYARAGRKDAAATERALFIQLDKQQRTQREGAQSVGGIEAKPPDKNPQK